MKKVEFDIFRNQTLYSNYLNREVVFDLIVPRSEEILGTLYMNDGQDFEKLSPERLLERYYHEGGKPFIWVAVYTNERRLDEYGTSHVPDYKQRGSLASQYTAFVLSELQQYVQSKTRASGLPEKNFFCGFSLGGLSALDIVWENPHRFSKVGVFSGALWWRTKGYEEGYAEDNDRIIHNKVKQGKFKPGLKFWFECGTNDEEEDRNKNGIIDSIDDTLELIQFLREKGYSEEDVKYLEVLGGEHNFNTWQAVFIDFLQWLNQ